MNINKNTHLTTKPKKMKKISSIIILSLAIITGLSTLNSCKKYEDDKGIKLRTVKNKLLNKNWSLAYSTPFNEAQKNLYGEKFPNNLYFDDVISGQEVHPLFINGIEAFFYWEFDDDKNIKLSYPTTTITKLQQPIFDNGITIMELTKTNLKLQLHLLVDTLETENSSGLVTLQYTHND